MRKSKDEVRAFWHREFADMDNELEQRRLFRATFVGPPKPRRLSGIGLGLHALMSAGDEMRAEVRKNVLQELKAAASEKMRQRGYRRWLAEYADRVRALQLATSMHEVHRIDVARKVADILERDGKSYDLDTIDDWLSKPEWQPPTKLEQS